VISLPLGESSISSAADLRKFAAIKARKCLADLKKVAILRSTILTSDNCSVTWAPFQSCQPCPVAILRVAGCAHVFKRSHTLRYKATAGAQRVLRRMELTQTDLPF
jgi:hypothetical protein